jgi:hypothetical protein
MPHSGQELRFLAATNAQPLNVPSLSTCKRRTASPQSLQAEPSTTLEDRALRALYRPHGPHTVGLESIAMFGNFGLFAVWCYTVEKSHLALQRESKVLLLDFLMDFISYNLNQ